MCVISISLDFDLHACNPFSFQKELLLSLRMPVLDASSHDCTTVLMDVPGFMEAMKKRVAEVAQLSLESSCVYLYVMSYDQLSDQRDDGILKNLCSSDKSKFPNRDTIGVFLVGSNFTTIPEMMKT